MQTKGGFRNYFHSIWDIRKDMMTYDELSEMMEENTIIHGSNMWILIMAIFIASIGLNVNSTAVIIGAMLVSPLMSGIITMGYSLAVSDLTMLKRALTRFGTQVAISLITSTVYFMISPLDIPTSEMIARTSPTLWDVLIALFGGIAGMIGNTRQKKGNVIPGVAIATALMPPLCTAGYGLATLQLKFLAGAFYLFTINTLFIMLSSALVTKLLNVPLHEDADKKRQRRIHRLISAITIIVVIPSILIGTSTVFNTVLEHNVNSFVDTFFVFPDTVVVQKSLDKSKKTISVSLVGETISEDVINEIETGMSSYNLDGYSLRVTQNKSVTAELENIEDSDKVTIAVLENTVQQLKDELSEREEELETINQNTNSAIDCAKLSRDAERIFTDLSDCSCGIMSDSGKDYILLRADSGRKLSAAEIQTIRNWLEAESGLDSSAVLINEKK